MKTLLLLTLFLILPVCVFSQDRDAKPWLVESALSNVPVQPKERNLWADANRGNTIADIVMPTQIGYELSDAVMSKILANLKNPAIKERLPKESLFSFKACPPDSNRKYRQPPENIKSSNEW
ncbi:hypothetical protein FACS1894170_05260 [Planctomycetales bacterium]|nr:hypothetical protein FACS1894170_05260 [Planctomycetales bacterium]